MSESRKISKRNRKINNILLLILMILPLLVVAAFAANIIRVKNAETGSGETIVEEEPEKIENEYTNAYYSIGYNATDVTKQYFKELDAALEKETPDRAEISSALVKCFVSEYYTWTNKDGNYDIGGMQYIYSDERADFEKYTRYGFYADMDLYLTQYGRDQLIEIKDVTINSAAQTDPYYLEDGVTALDCYMVDASWTYNENTPMDIGSMQSSAVFMVVDHGGRMEIAAINYQQQEEESYEY